MSLSHTPEVNNVWKSFFANFVKMCKDCVKEEYPERENTCLESGSYLRNYAGCTECQKLDTLTIVNRTQREEDEEESVTYQHVCQNCNHVVANHKYTFTIEDQFQMYEMSCMLCGRGDDQRSIMPRDPREQPLYL